ncbi:unnamed protein product, partial [Acidithrix sp. C25]
VAKELKGRFFVLEGLDGVGKSTQTQLVSEALRQRGVEVVETREPGGTPLGEALRDLIFGKYKIGARALALAMASARAQHCESVILPALERGAWVVCDRFSGSFLAYQGFGYGIDLDKLMLLDSFATDSLVPEMVFYIMEPTNRAMRELSSSDRFEGQGQTFQSRVRDGFGQLALRSGWVCIDGDGEVFEIRDRILNVIDGHRSDP